MIKSKKSIILLSIIILLIIMLILIVLLILMNNKNSQKEIKEDEGVVITPLEESLQKVTQRNEFYTIKGCVEKFYKFYESIFNLEDEVYIMDEEAEASIKQQKKLAIESVYNMLDQEYITFNNITKDNLENKIDKIEKIDVNVEDIYVSEKTNNVNLYIAQGTIREIKTAKLYNFKIMLKVDALNKTFTLYLQDYIDDKYPNFKIGDTLNETVPEKIETNTSNTYEFKIISDETYIVDLFEKYREEVIYNQKEAFENLDEEYRTKRFGTLENFQTFAKNNIKKHVIMSAKKYQKTVTDNYTQYVCMDQNDNYYIFRENSVMDYTLILDTYTIDLPEFVEKYNAATEDQKILINIQKCLEAINNQDYAYMYNKLDETYKNNYFKTLSDFEKYVKENFFTENKFSASNGQKQGEIYTYDITITDGSDNGLNEITKTFVMKLKEGTDFVMSFGV